MGGLISPKIDFGKDKTTQNQFFAQDGGLTRRELDFESDYDENYERQQGNRGMRAMIEHGEREHERTKRRYNGAEVVLFDSQAGGTGSPTVACDAQRGAIVQEPAVESLALS